MKVRRPASVGLVVTAAALLAVVAGVIAQSGSGAAASPNVVLVYNGPAIANTHAAPQTAAFAAWCGSECAPSVMLPVADVANGAQRGTIYVWTKHFAYSSDGNSLCFGEFIWYALADGNVYTSSGSDGTCGAFIDPSLKAPSHLDGAGKEIAGGGDGAIVGGGTGRYKDWTGTYTDRVFVEFNFEHPGANYYDQLFFSISRS
jgi:hypothetical protein